MEALLQLITENADIDGPFDEDTPLISSGMIDSFDLVNLITAIEEHYGVEIAVEEIDVDAFDTPRQMARWLEGPAS